MGFMEGGQVVIEGSRGWRMKKHSKCLGSVHDVPCLLKTVVLVRRGRKVIAVCDEHFFTGDVDIKGLEEDV